MSFALMPWTPSAPWLWPWGRTSPSLPPLSARYVFEHAFLFCTAAAVLRSVLVKSFEPKQATPTTPFTYGAVRLKAASVRLCVADHEQAQDCT